MLVMAGNYGQFVMFTRMMGWDTRLCTFVDSPKVLQELEDGYGGQLIQYGSYAHLRGYDGIVKEVKRLEMKLVKPDRFVLDEEYRIVYSHSSGEQNGR